MKLVVAVGLLLLVSLAWGSQGEVSQAQMDENRRHLCPEACPKVFEDPSEECVKACLTEDRSYPFKVLARLSPDRVCANSCSFMESEEPAACKERCILRTKKLATKAAARRRREALR